MALPHIPRLASSRVFFEDGILRRRATQDSYREQWQDQANYYHNAQIRAEFQAGWSRKTPRNDYDQTTADKAFHDSMNAWAADKQKELQVIKLEKRRQRLGDLLERERCLLEAEIKELSLENSARLDSMKYKIDALKSGRETARREEADQLLYDHFRQNNSELRQIASEMAKDDVVEQWADQIDEKQQRQQERMEAAAMLEAQEAERARLMEIRAAEEARRRADDEIAHKRQLQNQMDEIQAREQRQRRLQSEEAALMKEMDHLNVIEQKRKMLEARRAQEEHGRALLRQHKVALMRKSQRVQVELEEDLALLDALAVAEAEDKRIHSARRQQQRDEAVAAREMLQQRLREEQAKEAELDSLFADEAARQWEKRQQEWEKESAARAKLMEEVLQEREEQIQTKMEAAREAQEDNLKEREQLLMHLESLAAQTARDVIHHDAAATARRQEIDEQVAHKQREQEDELFARAHHEEEQLRAQAVYDQLVADEASRMRQEKGTARMQTARQLTHRR